ncbi:MAG: hypothetical protein WBQ23_16955 [Bacteroidota bacterium]
MRYLIQIPMQRLAAFVMLIAAFGLGACQTPSETPPQTLRAVTVNVQDANGRSMELIPVEMYAMDKDAETLLNKEVTDVSGNARFEVEIPTTGKAFRFIVGNATTGKMFVDANLLCRDTLMVVRLATEVLQCGETVDKSLLITNICAPLKTGERFTDSTQYIFTSTCDEALTFSIAGPAMTKDLHLVILGTDGKEITDRPFVIPAKGQFVVRAVATAVDSGLRSTTFTFNGTGPNATSATLNLTVDVDARNCNTCECPEETIIVDFGMVEASPTQGKGTRIVELPENLCIFSRLDNMIKGVSKPDQFGVPEIKNEFVRPGGGYTRTYTFVPAPGNYGLVEDSILIEHYVEAENKTCTTKVIFRGQGCGPECQLISTDFTDLGNNNWDYQLDRVRVYESGSGRICVKNIGECGTLTVNQTNAGAPGFSLTPPSVEIGPGETGCFNVSFEALDNIVWPNGHGQQAKVDHVIPVTVLNCGANRKINVKVHVDTLPALFSRCIYEWEFNGHYGYNFTPVEGKGEDHYDADPVNNQDADLVVTDVLPGISADVLIKNGWKLIKSGVTEAQFNFTDMSNATNGWSQAEYRSITSSGFNTGGAITLMFRSVYSVEVVRNGITFYACIRVREVSTDPDGKLKMCLDVLFPMIKE